MEWRTGVDEVGRNSNSLVVCDGISHVLVVVNGVLQKNKSENIKWNIKAIKNEVLNIAEAPKTAASAVLEASLGEDKPPQGEDKYFSYLLLCNTDFPSVFRF